MSKRPLDTSDMEMGLNTELSNGGFFKRFLGMFGLIGVIALGVNVVFYAVVLCVALTILYFFLAAAGVVPPQNVIPFIPFI